MASFDSADLLALFNQKAGRPAGDAMVDAAKYARLAKSQNRVIAKIASVCPNVLYQTAAYTSLPTLSTSDNQVFTFGTDANGLAAFPFGKAGIYTSLNNIPDFPLAEGVDYISEGTQIRIPNNRSYGSTLYWYGIAMPADIDASHQPSLFPEASRELIVLDAVRQFAGENARNPDLAAAMQAEWNDAWPTWCLVWRKQFRGGGALNTLTGRDLSILGGTQWAT